MVSFLFVFNFYPRRLLPDQRLRSHVPHQKLPGGAGGPSAELRGQEHAATVAPPADRPAFSTMCGRLSGITWPEPTLTIQAVSQTCTSKSKSSFGQRHGRCCVSTVLTSQHVAPDNITACKIFATACGFPACSPPQKCPFRSFYSFLKLNSFLSRTISESRCKSRGWAARPKRWSSTRTPPQKRSARCAPRSSGSPTLRTTLCFWSTRKPASSSPQTLTLSESKPSSTAGRALRSSTSSTGGCTTWTSASPASCKMETVLRLNSRGRQAPPLVLVDVLWRGLKLHVGKLMQIWNKGVFD